MSNNESKQKYWSKEAEDFCNGIGYSLIILTFGLMPLVVFQIV